MRLIWKLFAAVAFCGLALALLRGEPSGEDTRPNVLLIIVDTLRADEVHCYGSSWETSPNIDALAARSVLFERAISACSYTAPSHATILTGLHPRQHSMGYSNGGLRLQAESTVAEMLRDAGYQTAAFISNIVLRKGRGFERGFDLYDDELPTAERNRPTVFERTARATTEAALQWLARRGSDPFFLWVHYQDPHGPYTPPAPFPDGPRNGSEEEEPALPIVADQSGLRGIPAYQELPGLRRPSEYKSRYRGEVLHADRWIGELIHAAESVETRRPLVILFTSDHGESFGEEDYYFAHGHGTNPDLCHVPLILTAPGIPARRVASLVGHIDMTPTILDLAGLPLPGELEGVSLSGIALARTPVPDRILYCDIGYQLAAYRGNHIARVGVPGADLALRGRFTSGRANLDRALYGPADRLSRGGFLWRREGLQQGPVDPELLTAIRDYLARPAATAVEAARIAPADAERLRMLGYGEGS